MKLVLSEPKYLKEPVLILSELVNEARFKIDKDKIEVIAMDPASVAMVVFKLLASSFVEYNLEKEEEICINLDNFKQVLKRAKANDSLILELKDNKLNVTLKGDSVRKFSLSLINIEEEEQKVPDLKFLGNIEINNTLFNEAIEDMDVVAESVGFILDSGKFGLSAAGNLNAADVVFNVDDDVKVNCDVNLKARYSLEYLKKIIKGSKLSDNVVLSFSNDYPLKVEYKVMDKLSLVTILAPRVSNE
ncbi:MAG: proliferating cell nuclear antigen (pcna) [Nanoarchaeota archaeon]|nr:proliferating cell nuclear antigen (pcna) [Nanoarchaeota archaeon]